jgi:hypothetical protein
MHVTRCAGRVVAVLAGVCLLSGAAFAQAPPPVPAPAASPRVVVDRVLAVVSGSIITLSDARAVIDLGMIDVRQSRDAVGAALKWLIERRLVLDEALRYEAADPARAGVDEALAAIRGRFPDEAAWQAALVRLGLTPDGVRALVVDTLHAQAYINDRFSTAVPVSEDELREVFTGRADTFARDGKVPSFDEARATVEAVVQRERRARAITDWVGRLRRRAEVGELYLSGR